MPTAFKEKLWLCWITVWRNNHLKGERYQPSMRKITPGRREIYSRYESKRHCFHSLLGAVQSPLTAEKNSDWILDLMWNTESHNIPGGKQLQKAPVLQEAAASTTLPSLLLEFTSSGCILTQQSCIVLTSVCRFPSTEAQAKKGIPEFKPILLLDHKNHSVTASHKRSPAGTWCKTRKNQNQETKQTKKILKQRRKTFEIISPST